MSRSCDRALAKPTFNRQLRTSARFGRILTKFPWERLISCPIKMEPSTRLTSAMRQVFPPSRLASGYICSQCRHRGFTIARNAGVFFPPASSSLRRRYASSGGDESSFTERIRKRLWQTEPPGQKDPYNINEGDDALRADEARRVEEEKAAAEKARRAEEEKAIRDSGKKLDSQSGQYVPATTWDGLERVGGPTGWWEEAWDKVHQFKGFMAPSRMESKEDISIAIHRTLVEVYTLKAAGLSIVTPKWKDDPYDSDWGAVGFQQNGNSTIVPIFPNEQIRQKIFHFLSTPKPQNHSTADSVAEDVENLGMKSDGKLGEETQVSFDQSLPSEGGELDGSAVDIPEDEMTGRDESLSSTSPLVDESWLNVPFDDIKVKFMILKRVMQLTGIRIPDPAISDLTSAKMLLGYLVKKPKPKKLADRLIANDNIISIPNLHIMDRRYTPIDREKEVGRWKIIEKELIKRDLPVTGTG